MEIANLIGRPCSEYVAQQAVNRLSGHWLSLIEGLPCSIVLDTPSGLRTLFEQCRRNSIYASRDKSDIIFFVHVHDFEYHVVSTDPMFYGKIGEPKAYLERCLLRGCAFALTHRRWQIRRWLQTNAEDVVPLLRQDEFFAETFANFFVRPAWLQDCFPAECQVMLDLDAAVRTCPSLESL